MAQLCTYNVKLCVSDLFITIELLQVNRQTGVPNHLKVNEFNLTDEDFLNEFPV